MAEAPATTCACTRIHIGEASRPPDVNALRAFVDRVAPHVDRVAIAVGAPGIGDAAERLRQLSDLVARCQAATRDAETIVDVIPVDLWGAFTPALNALAAHASKQGCGLALFASVETTFSSETVAALREQLVTHDALVVGAALPGHDFQAGRRPLGGRTVPWNTLALWRLDRLCLVGFPLVADGVHAGVAAGVEEVATIRAAHALDPSRATAVLLAAPGVEWATSFDDPARADWHARKMSSKEARPAVHLELMGGTKGATVLHVSA
mmetsp:Transcript_808/g.2159  ORF Transcript_808/g.2159 Transcript_808/m.2159 type:complete len:266 (-) Transcript_808:26-823(-)